MGNAEAQKTFVEDILQLQGKLDVILKTAFFNQVRAVCARTVNCICVQHVVQCEFNLLLGQVLWRIN